MTARVASFETDARIIPNIICMPILVRNGVRKLDQTWDNSV